MAELTAEQKEIKLKKALDKLKNVKGPVMMALQAAQEIYGWLPKEVQTTIADTFGVPAAEVYGSATFYSQFYLTPQGKHKVGVCMGTACYVLGAGDVLDGFKRELGIDAGQTTEDMKFTLEATRCIGCCGLAPVMTVKTGSEEDVISFVKTEDVKGIVKKYKEKE